MTLAAARRRLHLLLGIAVAVPVVHHLDTTLAPGEARDTVPGATDVPSWRRARSVLDVARGVAVLAFAVLTVRRLDRQGAPAGGRVAPWATTRTACSGPSTSACTARRAASAASTGAGRRSCC